MKFLLPVLLASVMPLFAMSQEKATKTSVQKTNSKEKEEVGKKRISKKVYKSWVQVNQADESQSLSGKLISTFAKVLKPTSPKED